MPLTEEKILETMKQVIDPELKVNVVDLGLIYGVEMEEVEGKTDLRIVMTMTTPACPYGPELVQDLKDALAALPEAGRVEVEVTLSPPWTPDRMTDDARDELGLF